MEAFVALFGVLGAVAGIVQCVVVFVERRERRRRPIPHASATEPVPAQPVAEPGRYEPLFGQQPPIHPDRLAVAWRSCVAYLLGWIGGLVFRRDRRPEVRFHAAQSTCVDLAALLYAVVACCALVPYMAVRYPGPNPEVASDDVVMWTWTLTTFVGAPLLHLLLAVLALLGRHPRVPLLWRLAAAMAAREAPRAPALSGR